MGVKSNRMALSILAYHHSLIPSARACQAKKTMKEEAKPLPTTPTRDGHAQGPLPSSSVHSSSGSTLPSRVNSRKPWGDAAGTCDDCGKPLLVKSMLALTPSPTYSVAADLELALFIIGRSQACLTQQDYKDVAAYTGRTDAAISRAFCSEPARLERCGMER